MQVKSIRLFFYLADSNSKISRKYVCQLSREKPYTFRIEDGQFDSDDFLFSQMASKMVHVLLNSSETNVTVVLAQKTNKLLFVYTKSATVKMVKNKKFQILIITEYFKNHHELLKIFLKKKFMCSINFFSAQQVICKYLKV